MSYTRRLILMLAIAVSCRCAYAQTDGLAKVFILAGQSNMEGKGRTEAGYQGVAGAIGSLRHEVDTDPANYGHLVDDGGQWVVRDDVWIYSTTDGGEEGNLTVGFGSSSFIGPELGFGNIMGDLYDEQVVLIKTAWGGKSLAVDFRPPSSGGTIGPYYNTMLSEINSVLGDLGTDGQDYELMGFGWHQGWNDRINQTYNDEYEANMVNFINDVREDLDAPGLPFVIATTGMTGWGELNSRALSLMEAQLAMEDANKYPDFEGNVAVVETRDFWRPANQSPVDQGYHWNGNGETYYLIGDGMGEAMKTIDPTFPLGDLNFDEVVDALDWPVFIASNQEDLSALTRQAAYRMGDLDGDLDNDGDDFYLFRTAFEAANPAPGAFQAMLASHAVPEPSSILLLAAGAVGLGLCRRRRKAR